MIAARRIRSAVTLLSIIAAPLLFAACADDNSRVDGMQAPPPPSEPSGSGGTGEIPARKNLTQKWTFDDATSLPAGMLVGLGDWKVEPDPSAPSGPNVLRQNAKLAGAAYPLAFIEGLDLADLTVSVRCRAEEGSEDQACGLAFRVEDKDNYLITRANVLEGNIRFYIVQDGARRQLASVTRTVTSGAWHRLAVTAQGPAIAISWDGEKVLDATEATRKSGSVGLWTKADSITAFDDLEVSSL